MLILLLQHIIATTTCLWTGYVFYQSFFKKEERPLIFHAVSGLIILTLISQVAVLIIPINFYFSLSLMLLLVLIAIVRRKTFNEFLQYILKEISFLPLYVKALLVMVWLMILVINAGPVMMDDTESYHIQMIKWIQEYGSVPGIANLHERYGFNSSWFSSIALFNFSNGTVNLFTGLNGLLSLWCCYYIISSAFGKEKKNDRIIFSLLLLLMLSLIVWPIIRGNAANTNYDFISAFLIFIIFFETFSKRNNFSPGIEWIIWPVYLFTVRIINYPLLLLCLFGIYSLIKENKWRTLFVPVVCSLLLTVPFFTRNVILSGYLFFPTTYFDYFNFDWKTDPQMMERLVEFIKYYNRVNTTFLDIEQTKAFGAAAWIPAWFRYLYTYDKIILIPGLIGLLSGFIISIKNKRSITPAYFVLMFTGLCFIISWFLSAPDPRFVYGWLFAGFFLLSFHIASFLIKNSWWNKIIPVFITVLIAGIGFYIAKKVIQQPAYRNWVAPAVLPQPPYEERVLDGLVLRIPEKINNNWNARCYATPLPCLYSIDPRLKARGKTIRDGFRLEK